MDQQQILDLFKTISPLDIIPSESEVLYHFNSEKMPCWVEKAEQNNGSKTHALDYIHTTKGVLRV